MVLEKIISTLETSDSINIAKILYEIAIIEAISKPNIKKDHILRLDQLFYSELLNPFNKKTVATYDGPDFVMDTNLNTRDNVINPKFREVFNEHFHELITDITYPKCGLHKKENHQGGYHFHYFAKRRGGWEKINLLFTFDPLGEINLPPLYSMEHGCKINVDPESIGKKKRKQIYNVAERTLSSVPVSEFITPNSTSLIFYSP